MVSLFIIALVELLVPPFMEKPSMKSDCCDSIRLALSLQDWASKRVGFAKADHSQDEEVQGAIGSPEAGRWATAATHGATPF